MKTKEKVVCHTELRAKRKISYHKIKKRDDNRCQVCQWRGEEAHHITPIMYGGEDTMENMIWLCHDCHKHTPNSKEEFEIYKAEGGRRRKYVLGAAVLEALKHPELDMRKAIEAALMLYKALADFSVSEEYDLTSEDLTKIFQQ